MNMLNLNEVIPPPFEDCVKVKSQEDIVFLGFENLSYFQSRWKHRQKIELKELAKLKNELAKLEETPALPNEELQRMFDERIENIKNKVAEQQAEVDRIEEIINLISAAMLIAAKSKPIFPSLRKNDYFEEGEFVVFFDSSDGKFYNAVVVATANVQLNHPMVVYVRNGRALPCGKHYPPLMKTAEFEYLLTHPNYLKVWIKGVKGIKFGKKAMLEAFADKYKDCFGNDYVGDDD